MHIRGFKPFWKLISCSRRAATAWICKRRLQSFEQSSAHLTAVPSVVCCPRCFLVSKVCILQGFGFNSDYSNIVLIDSKYLSYILRLVMVHRYGQLFSAKDKPYGFFNREHYNLYTNITRNNTYWQEYTLKRMPSQILHCAANSLMCEDRICRVHKLVCTTDFQCSPRTCICRSNGMLEYDAFFCRWKCRPKSCKCAPLMFQCSAGGCIPYMYICDGVSHCADSSDEFCGNSNDHGNDISGTRWFYKYGSNDYTIKGARYCLGFKCKTGECIDKHFVNDLIPDCSDADDENHIWNLRRGKVYNCVSTNEIPCIPYHSKCFSIHLLCVYDHDRFGHIAHCRDGSHLFSCEDIECTNTFKCPDSYCIPLRKVCDGVDDCLKGEDESHCGNYTCPGYLKCNGVPYCVHLWEVCDGVPNCPSGDDEMMCDLKPCPPGCECLGHAIFCRNNNFPYTPLVLTERITYLSYGFHDMHTPNFYNLTFMRGLIIMDLSKTSIVDICTAFKSILDFYDVLLVLYLQHNNIEYISTACFSLLLSLRVLDLHDNQLIHIAGGAFRQAPIHYLTIASESNASFPAKWLLGLTKLKVLNIKGIYLSHVSQSTYKVLYSIEYLVATDDRLKCMASNVHHLRDKDKGVSCTQLLSSAGIRLLILGLGIVIFIFVGSTVWLNIRLHFKQKPLKFLVTNMLVLGTGLHSCYLITIASVDIHFGQYYTIARASWTRGSFCWVLSVVLSNAITVSSFATIVLNHTTYRAVCSTLFHEDRNSMHIMKRFLGAIGFLIAVIIALSIYRKPLATNNLCTIFGEIRLHHIWSMVSAALISGIMLVAFVHTLYISACMWMYVYHSGRAIQRYSAAEGDHNRKRLMKLSSLILRSIIFRMFECLPIPCIVFQALNGSRIDDEIQLMSIVMSLMFSLVHPILLFWAPWIRVVSRRKLTSGPPVNTRSAAKFSEVF